MQHKTLKRSDQGLKTSRQMYEARKKNYEKLLQKQKRVDRNISNLRLLVFIAGICGAVLAYLNHSYIVLAAALAIFIAIFIYLVIYQDKLIKRIKYTASLVDINSSSLKRLNGEWNTYADSGEDFAEAGHNYTDDLDIFGKNSLFQWTNTAKTFLGREKLKNLLSGIVGNQGDIYERQEAVSELAAMLKWRQRLIAEGMVMAEKISNPEELIAWGKESSQYFTKPLVIMVFRVCPIITILLITAGFFMGIIPKFIPATALLIQFALISYNVRDRYRMFSMFEKYNDDLKIYYKMLMHFEKKNFKSALINKIKDNVGAETGTKAYKQVDKLSVIVDSIANRRNMYYVVFNTLTLWDFQSIIALERWKQESGKYLKEWFDALGKVEALASLAVISFDNPHWTMPVIKDREALFSAKDMGHPLLKGKGVSNDLVIDEKTKVLLITGSNMSGKSTLLRTAGINLVLAYAGAPACAESFEVSLMEISTCMRIKDNLEESISSFYAELLRIKRIVSEADAGKRVFFLLDEIFRGTNSQDRHIGARVLINKLSHTNSIGLVSTHDLELCDLEHQNHKVTNYHFQEYYEEGKIHFDYKLRQGPSTTRNALHLMRLAGIDVNE